MDSVNADFLDSMSLAPFAIVVGSGLALAVLLVWLLRRAAAARAALHLPAEPVSLLVAEYLVRRARNMHAAVVLISTAIVAGGLVSATYAFLTWVGLLGFHVDGYLKTRRAAKLLADPAAGAELRGTRLSIVAHGAHATLVVSHGAIRVAKSRALPTSIAR